MYIKISQGKMRALNRKFVGQRVHASSAAADGDLCCKKALP